MRQSEGCTRVHEKFGHQVEHSYVTYAQQKTMYLQKKKKRQHFKVSREGEHSRGVTVLMKVLSSHFH